MDKKTAEQIEKAKEVALKAKKEIKEQFTQFQKDAKPIIAKAQKESKTILGKLSQLGDAYVKDVKKKIKKSL